MMIVDDPTTAATTATTTSTTDDKFPACETLNCVAYAGKYEKYASIKGLHWIVEHSSNLAKDAFPLLVEEIKKTHNTALYCKVFEKCPAADVAVDNDWVEETKRNFTTQLAQCEQELMIAKTSLNKEAMRLKLIEIATLHYDKGVYSDAIRTFLRAVECCTLLQQQLDIWMVIVVVCLDSGNMQNLQNYVEKTESLNSPVNSLCKAKLDCVSGLVCLSEGKFHEAALLFTNVDAVACGKLLSVVSDEDVAVYGCLCALATLPRKQLKLIANNNIHFKRFLEQHSEARALLLNFIAGNYHACFQFLRKYRAQLLLDVYLSCHVDELFTRIQDSAVLHYLQPFSSANLLLMASKLQLEVSELETVLTKLIWSKQLSGKIDAIAKVFHRNNSNNNNSTDDDENKAVLSRVLSSVQSNGLDAQRTLTRLTMLQHNITITANNNNNNNKENDRMNVSEAEAMEESAAQSLQQQQQQQQEHDAENAMQI